VLLWAGEAIKFFLDNAYSAKALARARKHRLHVAAILGGGIAAAYVLYAFNPVNSALYVPCPFHALTGLYCPGCGSLRTIHHLLHGHLQTAVGLNPLMVLSLPFLGYRFLSYAMVGIRGRSLSDVFVPALFIWMYLGVVLLFWVIRNISLYPFSLLAP
jgi:hypothetical protein